MIEKVRTILDKMLSEKRMNHTIGVASISKEMATIYGADPEKTELAAMLHDIGRGATDQELSDFIKSTMTGYDLDFFMAFPKLAHSYYSAWIMSTQLGITDEEVLSGARSHTFGSTSMSLIDKIIFVADYIEPSRDFEGVESLRRLAFKDLDQALLECMKSTLMYLLEENLPIHKSTVELYNHYLAEKEKKC